ncbi:MAG: hypothetical protein HYV60_20750, partial [Planctomycetia bacterium]|nr:hypothetical protein [Planctomycetia bacterium]
MSETIPVRTQKDRAADVAGHPARQPVVAAPVEATKPASPVLSLRYEHLNTWYGAFHALQDINVAV